MARSWFRARERTGREEGKGRERTSIFDLNVLTRFFLSFQPEARSRWLTRRLYDWTKRKREKGERQTIPHMRLSTHNFFLIRSNDKSQVDSLARSFDIGKWHYEEEEEKKRNERTNRWLLEPNFREAVGRFWNWSKVDVHRKNGKWRMSWS